MHGFGEKHGGRHRQRLQTWRYRSALRALISVVIAIFVPVHADAEATEIVTAFQDDGVFEEVQTNSTRELLPQVVSRCSASGHFREPKHRRHNTSAAGSELRGGNENGLILCCVISVPTNQIAPLLSLSLSSRLFLSLSFNS